MAVVMLSLVVFLAASEWSLRKWVAPISNTEPNRATKVFQPASSRVAVGDSHVYRGFLLAQDITNLGRGGTSLSELEVVLRTFYSLNPPGELVIGVSHQFFGSFRSGRIVEGGYADAALGRRLYLLEPAIASGLAEVTSGLDIPGNIRALEEKKARHDAHRLPYPPWTERDAEARAQAMERRASSQKPVWDEASAEMLIRFDGLVQDLLDAGVSICFLRTPLTEDYLRMLEPQPDYRRALDEFRAMAERRNIPYVDFRDLDMAWKPEMFLNQDHIQPQYSERFAEAVWESCFYSGRGGS